MIKPSPIKVTCKDCGYQKLFAPKSDALMPGEYNSEFCSKCGSTLCGIVDGIIHGVTLGCVNGDPGIKLSRHIYVDSKAGWEIVPEDVPRYSENAPENA